MSINKKRCRISLTLRQCLVIVLLLICVSVEARMQVYPTKIHVAAEQNSGGLTLVNTSNKSIYAQVRVFEWKQQDGEDQLVSTRSIIASPPMLKLDPEVQQLVRIVRNGEPPSSTESSYRIIVDEVPVETDTAGNTQSTLQFRLRYSIPVFLAPPKQIPVQPVLNTQLVESSGTRFVRISNEGNGHALITDLTWSQSDEPISIAAGLAGYVLPEQQQQWQLPDNIDLVKGGEFMARINGELVERILISIAATD